MGSTGDTLLAEFREAFPHVTRLPELQAQLLGRGWEVRSAQLPLPLQAYLDLVPLMLGSDTKLASVVTLTKPGADGALWAVLQHVSLRALSLTMVGFFDFAATAPIDPAAITALIGSAPQAERRTGESAEASWERASGPAALMTVNLGFAPAGDRMPGVRLVALIHTMDAEAADAP